MAAVSGRSSCVVAEHPESDLERDGERLFQDWCRARGKRGEARFDSDADRAECSHPT